MGISCFIPFTFRAMFFSPPRARKVNADTRDILDTFEAIATWPCGQKGGPMAAKVAAKIMPLMVRKSGKLTS